jgi:hypothetical protein
MDDTGISELLSMADSTMPAVDSMVPSPAVTQQVVEDNSAPASGTGQALESLTHQSGQILFKIHSLPQPPHTALTGMPTTSWAPEISHPTRSMVLETLAEALPRSTR